LLLILVPPPEPDAADISPEPELPTLTVTHWPIYLNYLQYLYIQMEKTYTRSLSLSGASTVM
jgi:hypothetical protein